MLYQDFYGLTGAPFQLGPDPRFYFASQSHRRAMAYLTYGLHQGEGFIVVTGDIGAGKTTLIGQLLQELDPDSYVVGSLATTQFDPTGILRMVADAFGLWIAPGTDKATLVQQLQGFFVDGHRAGRRPVLIVDEAQNLPMPTLEELRMLSNLLVDHQMVLQTVLLGQPQFRAMIARPELEQVQQRVVASCHLGPLSPEDTAAYVRHRLGLVGWQDDPYFTDDALACIHQATHGIPRRINTLCARLLLWGCLEQCHEIDGETVAAIATELHQETPGAPAGTAAGAPPAGLDALARRVAVLEGYVSLHERTIRRALELASHHLHLDLAPFDAAKPGNGHDAE